MTKLAWLAVAGALGTLARHGLTLGLARAFGGRFPVGTLAVNLLGCVLFGLVFALVRERARLSPETSTLLLVGFMGAFTTFSSFVADTHALWAAGRPVAALANVLVQNVVGLACFALGSGLGRWGW